MYNILFLILLHFLYYNYIYANPILIIFKMQNDRIFKNAPYYIPGGLNAIDNINYLLNSISFDDIVTVNDIFLKGNYNLASTHGVKPFSKKNNQTLFPDYAMYGTYGSELHEELFLKEEPINFYSSGYSITYNHSFVDYVHKLTNTFILTGLEGEKDIEHTAKYLTSIRKNVVIYLPGIVWASENNKNSTIEKMIKRNNIVINDIDDKNKLCKQILHI